MNLCFMTILIDPYNDYLLTTKCEKYMYVNFMKINALSTKKQSEFNNF